MQHFVEVAAVIAGFLAGLVANFVARFVAEFVAGFVAKYQVGFVRNSGGWSAGCSEQVDPAGCFFESPVGLSAATWVGTFVASAVEDSAAASWVGTFVAPVVENSAAASIAPLDIAYLCKVFDRCSTDICCTEHNNLILAHKYIVQLVALKNNVFINFLHLENRSKHFFCLQKVIEDQIK